MKRRTLDLVFSIGGLLLAALVLILGLVLQNQANFAHNYVKNQLTQQHIIFTPVAGLTAEEKQEGGSTSTTRPGPEGLGASATHECEPRKRQ
jgi:hypothetical protein